MNDRTFEAKRGLAQVLGLITLEGNTCVLHHEKMSYFTVQTELPDSTSEGKEGSDVHR
jgi:hypothetical protein